MEGELWGQLLDVLKDISNYLSKADSEQEKADIDEPPRIKEKQDEIVGGANPAGKEGDIAGFKKAVIDSKGKTQLKKADEKDEDDEEDKEDEKSDDDDEELKSLLKDIRSALLSKSEDSPDISKMVESEVKKALPNSMDRMLRKMGYSISRPDVVKFGVEDNIIKKSSDGEKIEKLEDDQVKEVDNVVKTMSKMSWGELGKLREKNGDLGMFPR